MKFLTIFSFLVIYCFSIQANNNLPNITAYESWKEAVETSMMVMERDTMPKQAKHLVHRIERYNEEDDQKHVLFAYNFLRELLHVPTASSFEAIDWTWFATTKENVEEMILLEDTFPSTSAMQALVDKAAQAAAFEHKITALSSNEEFGGSAHTLGGKHFIEVCKAPDKQLFVTYHELSHILRKDSIHNKLVWSDTIKSSIFLNEPSFKADLEEIEHYKKLGQKALANTSTVGKRLLNVLKNVETLWLEPEDISLRDKWLYFRGKEQRADLYAMKTLLKQGLIEPLLTMIEHWGNPEPEREYYVVAHFDFDEHPSDVERALYFIGFLAAHGIDVNRALKEWEEKGTCIGQNQPFSPSYTNASIALL